MPIAVFQFRLFHFVDKSISWSDNCGMALSFNSKQNKFAETSATGIEFGCARLGISCKVVESD
jgi:hypothetical protein